MSKLAVRPLEREDILVPLHAPFPAGPGREDARLRIFKLSHHPSGCGRVAGKSSLAAGNGTCKHVPPSL